VDGDVVETSNLHRQIAHATERVGMSKVDSAMLYLKGYLCSTSHSTVPCGFFPLIHCLSPMT
jgi:adenylyltransferase/sulfurtransferase